MLEGVSRGSLIVDMSTSSPLLARQLAHAARERGVGMPDAPVSGGDIGARDGTLSDWSEEEDDFERVGSLFEAKARRSSTSEGPGQVRWLRPATR